MAGYAPRYDEEQETECSWHWRWGPGQMNEEEAMAQNPFGAINGVGGVGAANPAGATFMQGLLAGLQLGGGQPPGNPAAGGVGDQFKASPELQEENQAQLAEMIKLARIRDLINEILTLQQQLQQQQQQGDQQGAAQTQQRLQQDMAELQSLMGNGQGQQNGQNGQNGGVPNLGALGAGAPGGGAPAGGYPGGGAQEGGGVPAPGGAAEGAGDGGGNLNAPVTDGGGAPVDVSGQLEPGGAAGIPDKYKDNPMAQLIWQESVKNGADPKVMLATAIVESDLNPKAVGDNGTSFGLYQYHIGGALGNRDANWAFNPKNIITDEAKRFASAGVRDGAGAAAVQRPADPVGYAKKVNNVMASFNQK